MILLHLLRGGRPLYPYYVLHLLRGPCTFIEPEAGGDEMHKPTDITLGEFQTHMMELGDDFVLNFKIGGGSVLAKITRDPDRATVCAPDIVQACAHLANWVPVYGTQTPQDDRSHLLEGQVTDLSLFLRDNFSLEGMYVSPGAHPMTEVRITCPNEAVYWVVAHRLQHFNLRWDASFDVETDKGEFMIEATPF